MATPTRIVLLPIPAPVPTPTPSPISPYTPQIGLSQSETNLCSANNDTAYICDEIRAIQTNVASLFSTKSNSSEYLLKYDQLQITNELKMEDIESVLQPFGYKFIRKICSTLQGSMYEATVIDPQKRIQRVAIKQTSKKLHNNHEAIDDGFSIIVEENIVKEAIILKHLTKDNRPNGGYIAKYVDFFETNDNFYLVTEYAGDCNLAQFIEQCHKYIKEGKMKLGDYRIVIKFVFWQISIVIHWLHQDMKCSHLDLCLENIIVQNCRFQINETTKTVSINPNIGIKVVDFGLAEIFHPTAKLYLIDKFGLKDSFETSAPEVYAEIIYDGMKADIWSLGIILYKICTGHTLYKTPQLTDHGFCCLLQEDKLLTHLQEEGFAKCFNRKSLQLMINMLTVDEEHRSSSLDILQSAWFETYYTKYASRIKKTSKKQKTRLKQQLDGNEMNSFPYYQSVSL